MNAMPTMTRDGFVLAGTQPFTPAQIKSIEQLGVTAVSRVLKFLRETNEPVILANDLCERTGLRRPNLNALLKGDQAQKILQERGFQLAYKNDGKRGAARMYLIRVGAE